MCYTHMQTRSGGRAQTQIQTHPYNTRSKNKETGTTTTRPFVPPVDTAIFFEAGGRRPSFTPETEKKLYKHPIKVGGVDCYECKISQHEMGLLPRKKNATAQQKRDGAFATIGHIVQWQDHAARNGEPQRGKWQGYEYEAFTKKDVADWYNDESNLELQSMSFNSSIAWDYREEDAPLTPTWV